jgi:hypothetical protein
MDELAARTIPPCWSARYRWVKARLSASAAGAGEGAEAVGAVDVGHVVDVVGMAGAAAAGPPGAHSEAREKAPTIPRRSRGPRELRMTGVALSGEIREEVLTLRTDRLWTSHECRHDSPSVSSGLRRNATVAAIRIYP